MPNMEEWIERYEEGSRSRFRLSHGEQIVFEEDKGFFSYVVCEEREALEIPKMVGDGRYWAKVIKEMVKKMGLKKALFFTKRNPAAWIRRYGGKIYGYFLEVTLEEAKQ